MLKISCLHFAKQYPLLCHNLALNLFHKKSLNALRIGRVYIAKHGHMSGFQRDVSAGWIVSVGCPEGLQARTHPYHHRLEHPKDAQHSNIPPDNTVQWLSVVVSGELSQCQEVSVVASLATCVWGDLCRKLSSPKVFSGPSDTAKNEGPWVKHVIWKWLNAPFLFLQNVAIICHVKSQQLKTLTAWMTFFPNRPQSMNVHFVDWPK